ncbi:hypothetical protein FKV75_01050 [Weissella paramesenteroides]|uniref:hypothetical protein n=1 Tax=Weissella paramesenteroides TaxID=1249 RepID=UPI001239DC22|nr:hypothetical protein [Weissella paramesenteroides]KAA8442505.1 hypothetical protein FKV77_04625 [Weissella paramesenteroides]KAA8442852.1 hypothetical protein FKV81_00615 [Weissella paramesenteroides]KAA8444473.1 hypothetical protein FKV75_01050 [Weissella paramesenteroides]KAA8448140.1 hypothetical protein FKV76_02615 [Weissella paramesenteroides]KAA8452048.1 hypothetical protein FKV74_00615 [Weissella paramesenteroides]
MESNSDKLFIDIRSMDTSALTWEDYAEMVLVAINNKIKNFIFSNDDIDYKFYAETRFNNMVSQAKIKLGISGRTIDFIQNKLNVHYAVNPIFPLRFSSLLSSLGQKAIQSAYVIWNENEIDNSFESLLELISLKKHEKIKELGISVTLKNYESVVDKTNSFENIDYVVIRGNYKQFVNVTFPKNLKVIYSPIIYKHIFSMVNLLFKPNQVLKSKFEKDLKLKELIQEFLNKYSINGLINSLSDQGVSGVIMYADNPDVLKSIIKNAENGSNIVPNELIRRIQLIKENYEG